MTYVEVLVQEGTNGEKKIVGISSVGHADYAESGKDVICAAISMAMHILESGVRRNLGIPCTIKTDHAKAEWDIEWDIKHADKASPFAEVVASSLLSIAEEYPDNVRFSEEVLM